MGKVHSGYLNLLMAFVAAMTLSLPVRAKACGEVPGSRAAIPAQAHSGPGTLPGPAPAPLCHLRCRGFVASVPDAPPQPHQGAPAPLEILTIHPLPAELQAVARLAITFPPGSSPPHSTVLRL